MSEVKGSLNKYFRVFLLAVIFAVVIYLVVRNISAFGNVLKVIIGFGAVILVHEFGHFIVAKLSGIKIEAFSIGFPPTLAGIRRTEKGYCIRILPRFFPKENDESGDGLLSFTLGKKARLGETEYRIGLVPFGGYNKMLGQDDTGPVKASDDPRSYANKPVSTRMAVITAGVFFNVITAILIFMMVFLVGIKLTPPVVGGVRPNSPAARAGLKPGDEIIEIAGKSDNLDFRNVLMAALLSEKDEKVPLKVKRGDDIIDFAIAAERMSTPRGEMRLFGIDWPLSLTIAEVSDTNALLEKTGLLPGDRIKCVNGKDVWAHWELEEIVENAFVPAVTVLAERTDTVSKKSGLIESQIRLTLNLGEGQAEAESELGHIYSMVPRLRVVEVLREPNATDAGPSLESGDIILAMGDVENPTYKEMREVVTEYEDKKLPVRVLRAVPDGIERTVAVTVVPKRVADSNQVMIGISVVLDLEHAVVAKTVAAEDGSRVLAIPRGAAITAVDGAGVSNFYDVAREIGRYPGERITIDWRISEEIAGDVALDVGAAGEFVTVKSTFAEIVPFKDLERLYQADGPVDAVIMGGRKTIMFIAQTYVTLKRLIGRSVSPKNLMGPVGILSFTYRVAKERPHIYMVYLLGLISACIAVFNFLPLPPLDGGFVVLLLIKKIKGSALSEQTQGYIAYAGWVLIGGFFLYVTFNDIVRSFFS